jgi:hypothetical protein
MTIPFHHIRKPASLFLGVMALCMVVFYASSTAATTAYRSSGEPYFQYAECGNPIEFIESSDNSGFSAIASQLPHIIRSLTPVSSFSDLSSSALFTNEALYNSRYLLHAFYVVVNIHAP